MSDKHQATFSWPAGPSNVLIKGSWDNWSEKTELTKTGSGFSKTLDVAWDSKITYKYIVDGQWKADPSVSQEYDGRGNLNNVFTSPPKPATIAPPASVPVVTKVEEVKSTAAEVVDSAAATAGATSILSYVTSGVGAAIATVTGYDPVNPQQIPVEDTPALATPIPVSEPEPTKDEPVVLHLDSDPVDEKAKEGDKVIPIPNAPEPYKETNGTLPAELESPTTDATSASHPTEATIATTTTAVEPAAKETISTSSPTKKGSETPPRASNASPPTTPKKFSFSSPRRSGSIAGSSIQTDTTSPNGKRKKRDSIFGKIKEVFHHSPKKEKTSP